MFQSEQNNVPDIFSLVIKLLILEKALPVGN